MDKLEFYFDWNNKFYNHCFAVYIPNADIFELFKEYEIWCNEIFLGVHRLECISTVFVKSICDFDTMVSAGLRKEDYFKWFCEVYPNFEYKPDTMLYALLFKKVVLPHNRKRKETNNFIKESGL